MLLLQVLKHNTLSSVLNTLNYLLSCSDCFVVLSEISICQVETIRCSVHGVVGDVRAPLVAALPAAALVVREPDHQPIRDQYGSVSTNQRSVCFSINQSEISMIQYQPIRDQYDSVSTNQRSVWFSVNQSEENIT